MSVVGGSRGASLRHGREWCYVDSLGYKFKLMINADLSSGSPITKGTMDVKKGDKFCFNRKRSRPDGACGVLKV